MKWGDATRQAGTFAAMRGRTGWARRLQLSLLISDAVVIACVMAVVQLLRFGWDPSLPEASVATPLYTAVSVGVGALWWTVLGLSNSRAPGILGHGPQELERVMRASWVTFAVVAIVGFLTRWPISRGYLVLALPIGTLALLVARGAWRLWIHARRDAGALQARVLVVGSEATVLELVARFTGGRRAGFRVVGVASMPGSHEAWDSLDPSISRLGELTDPVGQAGLVGAEFIVVAGAQAISFEESRKLGWALEGTTIGLLVASALANLAGPRVTVTPVAGLPLLSVSSPTFSGGKYWLKAAIDRVGAVVLLIVVLPLLIVIAVAVKTTSHGPALFTQNRVGLGMKPFKMFKFRSMYVDAERLLEEVEHQNEADGVLFKIKADPRVTTVGRVLRRFSLDELPQLLNVLRGEMSLVGPRPPLAREVDQWHGVVQRRQLVKPGMTGLWQVSGRSDLSWEESVRLDLYYAENWSLGGDAVIMLRTIFSVLSARGAY